MVVSAYCSGRVISMYSLHFKSINHAFSDKIEKKIAKQMYQNDKIVP